MKRSPAQDTRGLKALAVIGVAGMFLVPVLVIFIAAKFFVPLDQNRADKERLTEQVQVSQRLGEVDSACGGPLDLPCGPGTQCERDGSGPSASGVCVKAASVDVPSFLASGASCDETRDLLCDPVQYCRGKGASAVCSDKTKEAPHILSVKLDPSQTDTEGRLIVAGDMLLRVETVNANGVTVYAFSSQGGGLVDEKNNPLYAVTLQKDKTGTYYSVIRIASGSEGVLDIVVHAEDGSTNSLRRVFRTLSNEVH